MTTNSNIETAKPIRDIRWFWWKRRIYRYCFHRNLRDFVRLISCAKSLINCRELNRELGIGSARKYTYDTDPFIECCNSYIREIVVLMKSSHELFMVRDSCYKSFLSRRFEAHRIRNAITMLYWRYYYFPDPDK